MSTFGSIFAALKDILFREVPGAVIGEEIHDKLREGARGVFHAHVEEHTKSLEESYGELMGEIIGGELHAGSLQEPEKTQRKNAAIALAAFLQRAETCDSRGGRNFRRGDHTEIAVALADFWSRHQEATEKENLYRTLAWVGDGQNDEERERRAKLLHTKSRSRFWQMLNRDAEDFADSNLRPVREAVESIPLGGPGTHFDIPRLNFRRGEHGAAGGNHRINLWLVKNLAFWSIVVIVVWKFIN